MCKEDEDIVGIRQISRCKFNCKLMEEQDTYAAPVTFHQYHGRNIILSENNTVAYRKSGYAYGITFSREPLQPGEIFLLEIEEFEHGWIGNLRCGLTQENPSSNFELPQYALPGLVEGGQSWILPISSTDMSLFDHTYINNLYPAVYESNNYIHTRKGSFPSSILLPSRHKSLNLGASDGEESVNSMSSIFSEESSDDSDDTGKYMYPADVGSRIGVTYVIRNNFAEMYMLLNGDVFGPCATGIPYRRGPLYAVIDLYGTTKQVRIIQTVGIPSLKMACRDKILQQVSHSKVFHLPLPKRLIQFLTYKS
ncbi:neuralized-like protein 2 [Parasteatoda tepidariorum]|nr:neuralized-like protein 2 [Parasteatoda tepidariorum]XP_015912711.1 neuralized-like protein 2 [Parasteatoda tepidariorum]XP_042898115.1 neuralized-like protein 2 [Parasteatoda tepidariorum]